MRRKPSTATDDFTFFWNLYDILIPNENGRIDVQLLTLPYVKNYGWAINAMEMELIDDPCNGKHDFGWVNRQSCPRLGMPEYEMSGA